MKGTNKERCSHETVTKIKLTQKEHKTSSGEVIRHFKT